MKFLAQASYYDVLGIEPIATAGEIEAAYATRMSELPTSIWQRLLHQAFTGRSSRTLIEARAILTSVEQRVAYDSLLASPQFWVPIQ